MPVSRRSFLATGLAFFQRAAAAQNAPDINTAGLDAEAIKILDKAANGFPLYSNDTTHLWNNNILQMRPHDCTPDVAFKYYSGKDRAGKDYTALLYADKKKI